MVDPFGESVDKLKNMKKIVRHRRDVGTMASALPWSAQRDGWTVRQSASFTRRFALTAPDTHNPDRAASGERIEGVLLKTNGLVNSVEFTGQ